MPDEPVQPGPPEQPAEPAAEPPEPHRDDGLDLAKALTRATARLSPLKRARRRRDVPPPGRATGSHPDDRDPQLVDSTLERLVAERGWALDLRVHGVFARWAEIVGPEVGEHAVPESFADGRLVVRAGSTAWATQLRLLAPSLVARLNAELGPGTVTVVEVLGPHGPSWRKGPRSVRGGRGPRDTYG